MKNAGVNIVNKEYEHINFNVFSNIAEEIVSPEEKRRLMENFYQTAPDAVPLRDRNKRRLRGIRQISVFAAACLIICMAVTPLGDMTWAAARQVFMGIGHYLGMDHSDDYATIIDKTQTKNGVTVTLCEAVGSDNELRISFRAVKDGENMNSSKVDIAEYSINGINAESGLKDIGRGPFGTNLPEEQMDRSLHFWGAFYDDFEMPLNPTIDVKIEAGGEKFKFSFILENEKFKAATKQVNIDKTVTFRGKPIILKQLIITPIDQVITFENPEDVSKEDLWRLCIYGTDQNGDRVSFTAGFGSKFYGERNNRDHKTYMMNPDIESYTLRAKDEALPAEKQDIGESFTIQIKP